VESLPDRILALVRTTPGLTDREITDVLVGKGAAQQHVNQICRRHREHGLLLRQRRDDGKIGNFPAAAAPDTVRLRSPESGRPSPTRLTAAVLGDRRRALLRLLDTLEPAGAPSITSESIAARIGRLSRAGVIPREVAACMRTITEMRNAAEYEARTLSTAETVAVEGAWLVIREWARARGVTLPGGVGR